VETVDGHPRRVWLGREGQELIEHFDVRGMAHGTPLMPGTGEGQSGQARAHMLDVGLSSTDRIAAFFGIGPEVAGRKAAGKAATGAQARPVPARKAPIRLRPTVEAQPARPAPAPVIGIQKTIEDALRSAGLMK
jgi:hypothetical protein